MSPHPILTQRFDTSDVAFSTIDKEIAALREKIRTLHAFRNTFTSVHALPSEILTRIFSFVRHLPGTDLYHGNDFLKWIAVTHVSQQWRNVAIGSPLLWSDLSSTYKQHVTETWLRRSKSAPLS
ncbi:hypothetical protein BDN72DRAFT_773298, partial [Pluteus cervinus]